MRKLIVLLLLFSVVGCTRNIADIKGHAEKRLSEFGYEIVAYKGYLWSAIDGGHVWYQIRKDKDINDTRYSCYLTKWNNEYHLYGPWLVDKGMITAAANTSENNYYRRR